MPKTDAMMPLLVFRPICTFLKNVSQNRASVQEGMIYGKVKTPEINFLYFRLVLVTRKATTPPKRMAMTEDETETISVFRKGV